MRCASEACENAVAIMEQKARIDVPKGNTSEDDIWAVLHAENIKGVESGLKLVCWHLALELIRGFKSVGLG